MEYIKGLYMKKKTGKYGEYFVLSYQKEGIDALRAMTPNSDGFVTLIASPRKDNAEKYSIKPFVPKSESETPF